MTVGIIDYAAGNLGSVYRALEELKINARIFDKPANLPLVDGWILPGVGNFTESVNRLTAAGWIDAIFEEVQIKEKPFLGICLGMQLMADYGVEGAKENMSTPGLKLIPGYVENLEKMGCKLRIPHMGWNSLNILIPGALLSDIPGGTDFYFVHSYQQSYPQKVFNSVKIFLKNVICLIEVYLVENSHSNLFISSIAFCSV